MTTFNSVSNFNSITDGADLPRPDAFSTVTASDTGSIIPPRPLPHIEDSGRISFGAACRLPVRK